MSVAFATKSLVSTKSFNLRYAFRPMVSVNSSIARNVYHPLHAKTIERQREVERPQLIIDITSTIKRTSPKAVVRNRSNRRVREATYQVLKENGYGKDGKAKVGGKADLVGTLAFFTTTETVLTPWEELKADVRYGVVKWMALRQRNSRPEMNTDREDTRPRRGEEYIEKEHTAYRGDWGSGGRYQGGARQEPWRREERGDREGYQEGGRKGYQGQETWGGYQKGGREGYRGQEPWKGGEGGDRGGGGEREGYQGRARQEPWKREERWDREGYQEGGRKGYQGQEPWRGEGGGGYQGGWREGVRVKPDGDSSRGSGHVGAGPGEYPKGVNRETVRGGGGGGYQRGERERIDASAGETRRGTSGDRGARPGEYLRETRLESGERRRGGEGGEGREGGRTGGARGIGDERRDAKEYLYHPNSNLDHAGHAGGGNGGKEDSSAGRPVENTGHVKFRAKNPAHRRF